MPMILAGSNPPATPNPVTLVATALAVNKAVSAPIRCEVSSPHTTTRPESNATRLSTVWIQPNVEMLRSISHAPDGMEYACHRGDADGRERQHHARRAERECFSRLRDAPRVRQTPDDQAAADDIE